MAFMKSNVILYSDDVNILVTIPGMHVRFTADASFDWFIHCTYRRATVFILKSLTNFSPEAAAHLLPLAQTVFPHRLLYVSVNLQ